MNILNKTSKKFISKDVKYLKSFPEKTLGLLSGSNPRSLIFKTRFGIHTFGLQFPIDVLILDHNNRIVKIKQGLNPNRLFFWNPLYNLVIELPKGAVKKSATQKGDILTIS